MVFYSRRKLFVSFSKLA